MENGEGERGCYTKFRFEESIYDGELYDANKEILGWSQSDFEDCDWDRTKEFIPTGLGKVTDRLSLPVLIKETIKPVELIHTPAGEFVLDMGQNMVGWLRIRIHEPKGTSIKITHGEVLQDENFYRDNLRNKVSNSEIGWHWIALLKVVLSEVLIMVS